MSRPSGEVPSRTFKAGEVIFKEGDDAKSEAFLVHEGKVEIRKNLGGEDKVLNLLAKGQLLGELALFRNAPRSATAIAVEPDRKSTRLNSSHIQKSRMPSSA